MVEMAGIQPAASCVQDKRSGVSYIPAFAGPPSRIRTYNAQRRLLYRQVGRPVVPSGGLILVSAVRFERTISWFQARRNSLLSHALNNKRHRATEGSPGDAYSLRPHC